MQAELELELELVLRFIFFRTLWGRVRAARARARPGLYITSCPASGAHRAGFSKELFTLDIGRQHRYEF